MSELIIKEFHHTVGTDVDFEAICAFSNSLLAERWPEDPPHTPERIRRNFENIPPFVGHATWFAWTSDNGQIVGEATGTYLKVEHNQHLLQCDINVHHDFRRRGIGKNLLRKITKMAEAEGKRLLISSSDTAIPAGGEFAQKVGAAMGMQAVTNQLDIADLDRELIGRWFEQGSALESDFEIGLWDGPFPESSIADIVEMYKLMNSAPRDELDVEDFHWTPEQIRQIEQRELMHGRRRWIHFVRERSSDHVAGYTAMHFDPERPHVLLQGDTAVAPAYRNRGIGRWLKAAMALKALRERPDAKYIRTGNAGSNAPMLKINNEMGFKPRMTDYVWQVEVAKVRSYLDNAPISP